MNPSRLRPLAASTILAALIALGMAVTSWAGVEVKRVLLIPLDDRPATAQFAIRQADR